MARIANKKIGNITGKTGGFIEKSVINDNFVSDLRRIRPLTADMEKELFGKIEASKKRVEAALGSNNYTAVKQAEEKIQLDIRNEIISRNQYLNYAIAKRYDNTELVMDLVNVGAIGMIEAFEKYDYNKDVRFCTYATYYIRRAINAYLTKDNLMIRTTNDAKLISKVKRIENVFFAKEGRYPTPEEIKDILANDYDIKDVDTLDLTMANVTSIDGAVSDDDNEFVVENTVDYNEKTAAYNGVMEEEDMEEKRNTINMFMKILSDRERTILFMSTGYGYDRDYKDYEIGEELELTSERVRQIRLATIKKLQKYASIAAIRF
jgi:RNA polymerase primary sigma factor